MAKKILITGGSGFIGRNFISQQLKNNRNEILNLDNLTYAGSERNHNKYHNAENYNFVKGDICDKKKVSRYSLVLSPIF